MQKLLLFSLILLISSKDITFNTETAYNTESDNLFEFTYNNDKGYIFAYISCGTSDNVWIKYGIGISGGDTYCNKPGEGILLWPGSGKYTISIEATEDRKDSGTIWVNPTTNEIPVDLSKKYEGKYPIIMSKVGIENPLPELTYVISKAEKDVKFNFKYTDNYIELSGDQKVPNPFRICQDNVCFNPPDNTYEFKKGESYKIKVRMQIMDYEVVMPQFSFADVNYKESSGNSGANGESSGNSFNIRFNLWIISLFLMLL